MYTLQSFFERPADLAIFLLGGQLILDLLNAGDDFLDAFKKCFKFRRVLYKP